MDNFVQEAITITQYNYHTAFWLVPLVVVFALAVAFAFLIVFDWLMRRESWIFGSWIKGVSDVYKAKYYTLVVPATILGTLLCAGAVIRAIFS